MAMTPTQEPADVLAYGSREDLRSDEARAEYDRLKAERAAQGPGPAAAPAAEPGRGPSGRTSSSTGSNRSHRWWC